MRYIILFILVFIFSTSYKRKLGEFVFELCTLMLSVTQNTNKFKVKTIMCSVSK